MKEATTGDKMETKIPQCAHCNILRCGSTQKNGEIPPFCPTDLYSDIINETKEQYHIPRNNAVLQGWYHLISKILDPEKPREKFSWTRVDEIIEYATIREMKKIGIASCYALLFETKLLSGILESNGFTVISVSCLCGEVHPEDMGIPGGVFCNPIMQAEVLNREKTDLNIMVGLCIGHDILFLRYCTGETTPLIVKDRALGHNPVAALYISQNSFYKDRFMRKSSGTDSGFN